MSKACGQDRAFCSSRGFGSSLSALVEDGRGPDGPGSIIRAGRSRAAVLATARPSASSIARPGSNGQPIEVSGAIYFPAGSRAGGRPQRDRLGHPTSGVVVACAPALMPDSSRHDPGSGRHAGAKAISWSPPIIRGSACRHASLSHRGKRGSRGARFGARRARRCQHRRLQSLRRVGPQPGGHASLYTGELAASYAPD